VLRALSLSRNPMPPRTTRKSDRRKASDRTMVGTAQPVCLSASGTERRRYDSNMNLRKTDNHSVSSHYWGWTARPFPLRLTAVGEVFVLTSPFIEQDLSGCGANRLEVTCPLGLKRPSAEQVRHAHQILPSKHHFLASGIASLTLVRIEELSGHLLRFGSKLCPPLFCSSPDLCS